MSCERCESSMVKKPDELYPTSESILCKQLKALYLEQQKRHEEEDRRGRNSQIWKCLCCL